MKKNNLILGAFLAITAILFSGCGVSSSSESNSTEKVESITESTQSGDEVTIGNQVWTSKNLNVATYLNGDVIPEVQDKEAWANLTTGAWCYYDNKTSNGTKYGKIYNWFAVHDPRGLAPKGYHIPTDAEWTELCDYLGGEYVAGKTMKSTSGWYENGNGTNSSGFSALPSGFRTYGIYSDNYKIEVKFSYGGYGGIWWWSSTEHDMETAWYRCLLYENVNVFREKRAKRAGLYVRCVRD